MKYKDAVKELKKQIKRNFNQDYVPYENSKSRKTTDALIRGILEDFINNFMDEVSIIQAIGIQSQMIMIWSDLDQLLTKIKDLRYLINNKNPYEGSTFFISSKKAIDNFEIMVQSEQAILDVTKELNYRLKQYKDAVDSALLSNSSQLIGEMMILLRQVGSMWKIRIEAIEKYRFIY